MKKLDLETANSIIAAAFEKARGDGRKPLAIAVVGPEGNVISLQRQDGASMFRTDIAHGKAWGAVAMGASTRRLAEKARENPAFMQSLSVASGGRIMPSPGGVLVRDGSSQILGAVGVSGDSGANDETIAIHGIEAAGLFTIAGDG